MLDKLKAEERIPVTEHGSDIHGTECQILFFQTGPVCPSCLKHII